MLNKSTQFWFRLGIFIILVIFFFYIVPYAMPFILAFICTLLLWPLVNSIETAMKKRLGLKKFPRWLSIIPAMVLFTVVVFLTGKYVLIPFLGQFSKFINNVPDYVEQITELVTYTQQYYLPKNIPVQYHEVINNTIVRVGNYSVVLAQKAIQTAFSIFGFLVELLLVPILTFYMLKDGRSLVRTFENLFTGETKVRVTIVLHKIYKTLSGYIIGLLFLAINMFIIVFVVMSLLGLPYPLVIALLAAVAEWIPIIGPLMAAIPAIVLAATISGPLAIKVTIFYLLIQIIDGQITMPRVFGRFINLHPIVVISAVFIGGTLYGIKGMMLAVPFTAVIQIISSHLWHYDKSKGDLL